MAKVGMQKHIRDELPRIEMGALYRKQRPIRLQPGSNARRPACEINDNIPNKKMLYSGRENCKRRIWAVIIGLVIQKACV